MLVNLAQGSRPYQIVELLRLVEDKPKISRKIWFSRTSQEIARVQIFDDQADLVTDAQYGEWSEQDALPFAHRVSISRPKDGYDLNVRILKPGLNETISDGRFVLQIPDGVEVKQIGGDAKIAEAEGTPQ